MTDVTHPTPTARRARLARVARPSGAFAMLAVDQREAMRAMFAEHQTAPVTDAAAHRLQAGRDPHPDPVRLGGAGRQAVRLRPVVVAEAVAPTAG